VMQHLIATYGLLAVWVLMAAESACIPVPSEVTMFFAGALAAGAVSGPHPSLTAVIVAGTLGNVVGSYLAWLVGKYGGRPGLRRWGRYVGLGPHEIDKAQDRFDRCGASVVFWSRLLPGIRTFISLPAGIAEMPAARFGLYTAAGCLPWTAALAIVGYRIGANWQTTERAMHRHSIAIAVVVFVALGIWVLRAIRHNRHASPGEAASSVNPPTTINAWDQGASRWREIVCSRRTRPRLDDDDALRGVRTGPTSLSTTALGSRNRPSAQGETLHGSLPRWQRLLAPTVGGRGGVGIVGPRPIPVTMDTASCEVTTAMVRAAAMPTEKLPLTQRHAAPARPPAHPATTASRTINTSDEAK
jgi:membrane protein DedA with SNARE-associated domain